MVVGGDHAAKAMECWDNRDNDHHNGGFCGFGSQRLEIHVLLLKLRSTFKRFLRINFFFPTSNNVSMPNLKHELCAVAWGSSHLSQELLKYIYR